MRLLESSDRGPKALEVENSCMLGDVASICARSGGERLAPSLRSAACCVLRSLSMLL